MLFLDGEIQINTWMNVALQKFQCTMKPCCYSKTLFKARSQEKVFRYLDRDPRWSVLPMALKETSMNAIFIWIMTYTQKTLKAAADNQSIPFHKEGKGQHQNNNMITYDLILWIPIYLVTQREGIEFLLRKGLIVPWMFLKHTF